MRRNFRLFLFRIVKKSLAEMRMIVVFLSSNRAIFLTYALWSLINKSRFPPYVLCKFPARRYICVKSIRNLMALKIFIQIILLNWEDRLLTDYKHYGIVFQKTNNLNTKNKLSDIIVIVE